ncbi:disulfide oxidoreductase [Lachnospiraceae bacterium oral taxon 500]|nr:disulfide oxidoreductase [Lachnospiraceae bacterium oral taxon 500]
MITREMLIGDIVNTYPEAAGVLMSCGMHCLGCPASQAESLEEACMVHGLDAGEVLKILNEDIAR